MSRGKNLSKYERASKYYDHGWTTISIYPTLSEIYERCMYNQKYEYFDQILSKYQCGFRQVYKAQHCDDGWEMERGLR